MYKNHEKGKKTPLGNPFPNSNCTLKKLQSQVTMLSEAQHTSIPKFNDRSLPYNQKKTSRIKVIFKLSREKKETTIR